MENLSRVSEETRNESGLSKDVILWQAPRPTQFPTTPPTQFRRVALYPPPNRNVIHVHVPLCHDLFEVSQAQRISKITTNAQYDDLGFEMSSFEYHWPVRSHERQAYQKRPTRICNTSLDSRYRPDYVRRDNKGDGHGRRKESPRFR